MFLKKPQESTDTFWKEYEENIGEKVLARSLGKYITGWEEFDAKGWSNIWGLIIVTESGLRFHNFPQHHWMDMLNRNREPSKERIFSIQRERLISAELVKEANWFLRLFKSPSPQLIVSYKDELGGEKKLFMEADLMHGDLLETLNA